MTQTTVKTLRIGHSPDPDDAFMWYPLADLGGRGPRIDTGPYRFVHVLEDIESLNKRSEKGELEITALSIHQYPYIADKYAMTSCGSSMGDGYGPMVIGRTKVDPKRIGDYSLAIPGERTTAWLSLKLLMRELGVGALKNVHVIPFDQIIPAVSRGEYDLGLIIHEGQLTYGDSGLQLTVDLGQWWKQTRGLPLPLGGNAIRRDLTKEFGPICRILFQSIEYALEHREEAVEYALNYARDMGRDLADKFVGMYVNKWTMDYGPVGRQAVGRLLAEARQAGFVPDCGEIDFVDPG